MKIKICEKKWNEMKQSYEIQSDKRRLEQKFDSGMRKIK